MTCSPELRTRKSRSPAARMAPMPLPPLVVGSASAIRRALGRGLALGFAWNG